MAHQDYRGLPPIEVVELMNETNPKEGLVYFIERLSDNKWLHQVLPGFTSDPLKALSYKEKKYADQYLKTIQDGCSIDDCIVTEHMFI